MSDYLIECQELLETGEYGKLLKKLQSWGSDAPSQLWAVVAFLAMQKDQATEYLNYSGDPCPNHGGSYDCNPFCELCEGNQELSKGAN